MRGVAIKLCTRRTRSAVRSIQPDAKSRGKRPATNIELTAGLVRQDETSGAEHVGLDVHGAEGLLGLIRQAEIKLVGTRRVRWAGAPLLDKRDLVVYSQRRNQRDDQTADKELRPTVSVKLNASVNATLAS